MKKYRKVFVFMLLLTTSFLMSCSLVQNDQPGTSTGTGRVVVNITDAPFPVKEVTNVYVNIDTVDLRIKGGTCTVKTGETVGKHGGGVHDYSNFSCDSGFVFVWGSATPKKIDLLKLQNGVTTVLADATIPAGSYDMIRMHLASIAIVTADSTYDVKIPACYKRGLRLKLDSVLTVTEGEDIAEILVDIDLSRSLVSMGYWNGHGKKRFIGFYFQPIIRAINHKQSGCVFGKVYEGTSTAVESALITVLHADTLVTTALTDSLGKYKVIGLKAGTYGLKAEKTGYKTVIINGIKLDRKESVKQNIQLVKQ